MTTTAADAPPVPGAAPRPPEPGPPDGAPPAAPPIASLKTFVADNSALLSQMTVMTSLCGFIVNFHLGWLGAYLKAALLIGATLLWLEFHAQWPQELRLAPGGAAAARGRHRARPHGFSWRLVLFAYLMQISLLLFVVWALSRAPEMSVPLLATGLVFALWTRLGLGARHRPWLLAALLLAAFVLSEATLEWLFPDQLTLVDRVAEAGQADLGRFRPPWDR